MRVGISAVPRLRAHYLSLLLFAFRQQCGAEALTDKGAAKSKQSVALYDGRRYSVPRLLRLCDTLASYNLVLFIIFRFVGIRYYLAVVVPYCNYAVTSWMGGTTLALSLMAMVVMLQGWWQKEPRKFSQENSVQQEPKKAK